MQRQLEVRADGFEDVLELQNTGFEPQQVTLKLTVAGDFADMFEARGWEKLERTPVELQKEGETFALRYEAQDGAKVGTVLGLTQTPDEVQGDALVFKLTLAPKEAHTLSVTVTLQSLGEDYPGVGYEGWLEGFPTAESLSQRHQEVLTQAQQDLRALLLFTKHGPYLAAGIPWYVAAFGRDALLAASMLLPAPPGGRRGRFTLFGGLSRQKVRRGNGRSAR